MNDNTSDICGGHKIGDTVSTPNGRGVITEFSTGAWSGKPMVRVYIRRMLGSMQLWFYIHEVESRRR